MKKNVVEHQRVTLSKLSAGVEAQILELTGGRAFRSKAFGLGLKTGARLIVKKTSYSANGCLIIALGDLRVVIGRGIADKIIVSTEFSESLT